MKMSNTEKNKTILSVKNITKRYRGKTNNGKDTIAVDSVSFDMLRGETIGLVGESGCGKSTLAKILVKLISSDSGSIIFDGMDITHLPEKHFRKIRRNIQLISQNPLATLDPRMRIIDSLSEGVLYNNILDSKSKIKPYLEDLMEVCELSSDHFNRYPSQMSVGQLQRVSIVRALSLKPKLIIADEIVSALDVSVQGQIIDLLQKLKEKYRLSMIFISHDLAVIRSSVDTIFVMRNGSFVDFGTVSHIFNESRCPYTMELLAAIPEFQF